MILHNISGHTFDRLTFYDDAIATLIDLPFVNDNVTLEDHYQYHPFVKKLLEDNELSITSYTGLSPDEIDAVKESDQPDAENPVITTSALPEETAYPADAMTEEQVNELLAGLGEGDAHFATLGDVNNGGNLTADQADSMATDPLPSAANLLLTAQSANNVYTANLGIIHSSSLEDASGVHQLLEVPNSEAATATKISVCCVKADSHLVAGSRTLNLKVGASLYPIVLVHTDAVVGVIKEAAIAEIDRVEKADSANWVVETLVDAETAFTEDTTAMWNFYVTYEKVM